MNPISTMALADEHIRDLHADAAQSRLVALARCCHPATRRRIAQRLADARTRAAEFIHRGQLGPANNYCAC